MIIYYSRSKLNLDQRKLLLIQKIKSDKNKPKSVAETDITFQNEHSMLLSLLIILWYHFLDFSPLFYPKDRQRIPRTGIITEYPDTE